MEPFYMKIDVHPPWDQLESMTIKEKSDTLDLDVYY